MDELGAFLRAASARPFGCEWNCGLWLADWYVAATGRPDPAAYLRGRPYEDRHLARHTLAIVRALGLPRTAEPSRGDIGLVRLAGATLGGICTAPGRWAVIGRNGLSGLPTRPLRAWKVG